ncbi:cysteine hydrolase [Sphaerisporangium sp. NPDC051011]|uniref:cysteine hydrolase family protein n=1 Tax=Sphaerisporangium sp. NPDC051011 TaxID=3155792 RepID=UPI0034064936
MTSTPATALVVVDLQNDFCAGPVALARYAGDPARLDAVAANTALAVDRARSRETEVIFVRFAGDVRYQGPSWRRRDRAQGKRPKCREGSWGADFYRVSPMPGEQVFTKRACFDAFLSAGFERHLVHRGVGRLVFAGLFTDVCVDSTARTAFQKGFHVTVLSDCTTGLHLPEADILRFMAKVYGAHITTQDRSWTPPAGEEDACQTPGTPASKAASG